MQLNEVERAIYNAIEADSSQYSSCYTISYCVLTEHKRKQLDTFLEVEGVFGPISYIIQATSAKEDVKFYFSVRNSERYGTLVHLNINVSKNTSRNINLLPPKLSEVLNIKCVLYKDKLWFYRDECLFAVHRHHHFFVSTYFNKNKTYYLSPVILRYKDGKFETLNKRPIKAFISDKKKRTGIGSHLLNYNRKMAGMLKFFEKPATDFNLPQMTLAVIPDMAFFAKDKTVYSILSYIQASSFYKGYFLEREDYFVSINNKYFYNYNYPLKFSSNLARKGFVFSKVYSKGLDFTEAVFKLIDGGYNIHHINLIWKYPSISLVDINEWAPFQVTTGYSHRIWGNAKYVPVSTIPCLSVSNVRYEKAIEDYILCPVTYIHSEGESISFPFIVDGEIVSRTFTLLGDALGDVPERTFGILQETVKELIDKKQIIE